LDIKKIFDPLFTTDPSRKISDLGLSICSQIIKLHGGNIYAKNNLKGGLSIYFTIKDSKE
jgi:signal transduction histidine kinase